MIERLLAAEAALDRGQLDTAGLLFDQVVRADPRNAIALVGLAKIALREDRFDDARDLAEQALAIDPDEAAAQRVLRELYAERRPAPEPEPVAAPEPVDRSPKMSAGPVPARRRPSLFQRLRRWLSGARGR